MNEGELNFLIREYITNNLSVQTNIDSDGDVIFKLILEGEEISMDYIPIDHME